MKALTLNFILLLSSTIAFSQINLSAGLRAKYDFSGNANDLSGNNFNGVNNGATLTFDRFGNQNSAYAFDGISAYIDVLNFASMIPGTEMSLSIWVKADGVKTQGLVILEPDSLKDRFFAGVYYDHNGTSSTFWDFGDMTHFGRLGEVGTFFQPGWEHYVFIVSAAQNFMQVYRNGYLKLMKTNVSSIINKNRSLNIGGGIAGATPTNNFFQGTLDDIRIYDRVLNPTEIMCLYNGYEGSNIKDLRVFITNHPNARPGFNENLYVTYQNVGTATMNGYVELNYDTNYNFIQATPSQDSIAPHYLGWNVNNLPPGGQGVFTAEMYLPASISLGTQLQNTAKIYPIIGDTTDFDNFDTLNQIVVGGYDPNYLEVLPRTDISPQFVTQGSPLYYIIHFQNTGTASAINVRTENFIDTNLIVSSVEVIASSHSNTFTIGNNNKLTFTFDGINLPDSGSNQSASNGFVIYKVKTKSNLVIGDSIKNTASIYFDFNLPVITNTTTTKVPLPSSLQQVHSLAQNLKLFPNPVSNSDIFLLLDSQHKQIITIQTLDINNKIINELTQTIQKGDNIVRIPTYKLSNGVYFLQCLFEGRIINEKFVKQ